MQFTCIFSALSPCDPPAISLGANAWHNTMSRNKFPHIEFRHPYFIISNLGLTSDTKVQYSIICMYVYIYIYIYIYAHPPPVAIHEVFFWPDSSFSYCKLFSITIHFFFLPFFLKRSVLSLTKVIHYNPLLFESNIHMITNFCS